MARWGWMNTMRMWKWTGWIVAWVGFTHNGFLPVYYDFLSFHLYFLVLWEAHESLKLILKKTNLQRKRVKILQHRMKWAKLSMHGSAFFALQNDMRASKCGLIGNESCGTNPSNATTLDTLFCVSYMKCDPIRATSHTCHTKTQRHTEFALLHICSVPSSTH